MFINKAAGTTTVHVLVAVGLWRLIEIVINFFLKDWVGWLVCVGSNS